MYGSHWFGSIQSTCMRLGDTDAVHSHHEYTIYIHENCLDMIWLRALVCSCISMYVHVYLYASALFQQTKRAKAKVNIVY